MMTIPTDMQDRREALLAMRRELQCNRILLKGMRSRYGVFLFTGGDIPRAPCELAAITSYLDQPFAAEHIPIAEVDRYRSLAETLIQQGQTPSPRPRPLPCRRELTDAFNRLSSEMEVLESALERDIGRVLQEGEREPSHANKLPTA
jgi:hypothetical protein